MFVGFIGVTVRISFSVFFIYFESVVVVFFIVLVKCVFGSELGMSLNMFGFVFIII